jgi:flagellar hook assembly protein FlgD
LSPGWHSWTWTGHDNRGKQVPDGYYEVRADVFFANSGTWQGQVLGRALVHRHYYPGYLTSQFPALYPRSTTIHDSTTLENQRPFPTRATMRVRNRSGKVVFTRAVKALRKHMRVMWDGRDARGRPLPAGNYYAKVSGVDMDGLRGSTEAQKVVVSAKRLVSVTRTVTLSPSASITNYMDWRCSGCLDNPPPPPCGKVVASDRFTEEGALSYRSGTDPSCEQSRWVASTRNALTLHERAPRGGSTSVAVFGGPTTPGASDQGSLSVTGATGATVLTGSDTSDHTTTTPWVPIVPGTPRTHWSFGTRDGSSYDAATFTVRVKFLTARY